MNRRSLLRSLAAAVATVACVGVPRLRQETAAAAVAPSSSPLFSGMMGSYEGLTIRHIERAKEMLALYSPRTEQFYLIVPQRQVRALQKFVGSSVKVRSTVPLRLRQGGWT